MRELDKCKECMFRNNIKIKNSVLISKKENLYCMYPEMNKKLAQNISCDFFIPNKKQ